MLNTKLIPAYKWNESHNWPSLSALRQIIFNANTNGFDAVIKRVGRRVLIDETAFFVWVEQQNK